MKSQSAIEAPQEMTSSFPRARSCFAALCCAALCCAASCGLPALAAPDVPIDPSLGESIVEIPNSRLLPVSLETTLFRPPADGPFPVVVINHGKATGPNRLQPRYRPLPAVREFLMRGYAVVVPMRQGFSNSGGKAVGEGCNTAGNGSAQAEDVAAVVGWIARQPWADAQRMVMLGQSHGGLTTPAYARDPAPGFKLFVNFAGGLRLTGGDCNWQTAMVAAFGSYGGATRVPSLWFYGANDSFFPPEVIVPAHAAYVAAGGQAELIAYGPFGSDAHAMFGSRQGLPLWWPKVEARLSAAALPTDIVYPEFAAPQRASSVASGASR